MMLLLLLAHHKIKQQVAADAIAGAVVDGNDSDNDGDVGTIEVVVYVSQPIR